MSLECKWLAKYLCRIVPRLSPHKRQEDVPVEEMKQAGDSQEEIRIEVNERVFSHLGRRLAFCDRCKNKPQPP